MLLYYVIYYEKLKKVMQQTDKVALSHCKYMLMKDPRYILAQSNLG